MVWRPQDRERFFVLDYNKTNDVIPDVLFYIGDNLFYKNQPKMYSFQMIHLFYGQNEHFGVKIG